LLPYRYLEGDILCESVGSIISSTLGVEFWPGYANQEEDLRFVGESIESHIKNIALDPSSAPKTPIEFALNSVPAPPPASDTTADVPDTSTEELQRAFNIMNFQLPSSLLAYKDEGKLPASSRGAPTIGAGSDGALPRPPEVRAGAPSLKVNVCLPTGNNTDMTIYPGYHLGRQVEAFLLQHNMEDDDNARHKLINVASQLAQRYFQQHKPPMPVKSRS
jgi:hypothetical protein